jgi:hypothetical protein
VKNIWTRFRGWPRWLQILVAAIVVLIVIGIANGSSKKTPTAASPPPAAGATTTTVETTTAAAKPKPSPKKKHATPAVGAVTGFGARDVDWNRTHAADTVFAPGSAYNADLSLPGVNGHTGVDYSAVQHTNGHVLGYEYHFADLPIASAKALVLRTEFPSDARIVWFVRKDTCAQMMVRSAKVGHELGTKTIGDAAGAALVEFSSGVNEDTYNPSSVNDALFLLLPLESASQAPGC